MNLPDPRRLTKFFRKEAFSNGVALLLPYLTFGRWRTVCWPVVHTLAATATTIIITPQAEGFTVLSNISKHQFARKNANVTNN